MGREKALASAGHVYSLNIPEKLIYMQPDGFALTEVERSNNELQRKIITSRTMSIFSRVCDSKVEDPLNCVLFKKGRTGSTLSRIKYVKCFGVETNCYRDYRVVLRLKFIVTVELLYDQAQGDFVQCQTKMRAFASRICSEFKQIELN